MQIFLKIYIQYYTGMLINDIFEDFYGFDFDVFML